MEPKAAEQTERMPLDPGRPRNVLFSVVNQNDSCILPVSCSNLSDFLDIIKCCGHHCSLKKESMANQLPDGHSVVKTTHEKHVVFCFADKARLAGQLGLLVAAHDVIAIVLSILDAIVNAFCSLFCRQNCFRASVRVSHPR